MLLRYHHPLTFTIALVWLTVASLGRASSVSSASVPLLTPPRVSYSSLIKNTYNINHNNKVDRHRDEQEGGEEEDTHDGFLDALRDVGLVSITDIPSSWNKQEMLQELERCITNNNKEDHRTNHHRVTAPLHIFPDGTHRRTLATRSIAGQPDPLFPHHEETTNGGDDCRERLIIESIRFRQVVQDVTDAVASRLNRLFDDTSKTNASTPILLHDVSGQRSYTMQQVVTEGEHLEHFHCYFDAHHHVLEVEKDDDDGTTKTTIDWHTDQGLLLVFTPGQRNGYVTNGFYIQLEDGTAVEVDFDIEKDDLMVMLGDGVHQYVNPVLKEKGEDVSLLRAVPHALRMERSATEDWTSRVWYGRMVLPPPQALHPSHTMTFSDLRSSMINQDPYALSLGCASHHQVARELADGTKTLRHLNNVDPLSCSNDTSAFCWHECMNYTDFDDVSPELCDGRALSVGCVNDEGYLWIDEIHDPAFQLGCVNLSEAGTIPADVFLLLFGLFFG
jgi:hypothetical protein